MEREDAVNNGEGITFNLIPVNPPVVIVVYFVVNTRGGWL